MPTQRKARRAPSLLRGGSGWGWRMTALRRSASSGIAFYAPFGTTPDPSPQGGGGNGPAAPNRWARP